jgi:imidazolonepropionase-like amidohydrolase
VAFLIEHVNVFRAVDDTVVSDWSILVDGPHISWIGPADHAPSFAGPRIQGRGRFAMPGLIDSHVHLAVDGSADFFGQMQGDSVQRATLRAANSARAFLDHGITTVRDCGAANSVAIELSRAIDDGIIEGPRVLAAGRVITMTGGHGYYMGREADGADAARSATRAAIKEGSEFIKAMATGGVLTPGVVPQQVALLSDELVAITREAHNAGKRVTTHALNAEGIKNALRAGVDSIEHAFGLDDEAIELALASGTVIVPTLVTTEGLTGVALGGEVPDWVVEKARALLVPYIENFKVAVSSGLKIAAGTDSGSAYNPHGALAKELRLMVACGVPVTRALLAATRDAAQHVGLGHRIGTLEQSKQADLIILDRDPTADLETLAAPSLVVRAGRVWLDRATDQVRPGR